MKMSSFVCDDATINVIVGGVRYMSYTPNYLCPHTDAERAAADLAGLKVIEPRNTNDLGRFLHAYNQLMTGCRYRETPATYDGAEKYAGEWYATPGEVYGACACYDYQVSEDESYNSSCVRSLIEMIQYGCSMAAFKQLKMQVPYGAGGHDMAARY